MSRDRGRTRCDLLVKFAGLFFLVMLNNAALQTEREPIQVRTQDVRRKAIQKLWVEIDEIAGCVRKWRVVRKSREKRTLRDSDN